MILSISDISNQIGKKIIVRYLMVSILCLLFSQIYEAFSHEVYSSYMLYLFLIPLILGGVVFSFFYFLESIPYPKECARVVYHGAVVTLSVGSCLTGILEIYGTTSSYISLYGYLGVTLLVIAIVLYIKQCLKG